MAPSYVNEPIAVIGSGCRLPGDATNPSKLWALLQDPRDVQRKIDRFRADNFHNKDGHYHGASNVLAAYLLEEDPKLFDTQFFNIPLSEAEAIDPQQRLLLETVYESLETAGISMESLSGSNTAVYVGVMCNDFEQIVYGDPENVPTYASTGSHRSILSNRLSYFFNWHGPSMTIDTACSSSLVAVHQAVQALRTGESPVAVAAGTNLIFTPTMFVSESNLNMLSKDGRSRMWDANANGYARGEGVGSIVMKTLSAALRDGDHIEYIIRETGVNQDGKTPGITMPSSEMQAALIRDTYARAGLDPLKRRDRCQYFEAHGTGTPAGDPQEAGAIFKAFFADKDAQSEGSSDREGFEDEDILYVGSVKTIIGHTEGTAGIAGVMKAALAIQNKTIPPNMLFTKLNPALEPYYNNLKIPIQLRDWPDLPAGVPRRASVNSFGFGGANAHAIIESYEPEIVSLPKALQPSGDSTPYTFVFSAISEKSLAAQLNSYLNFLEGNPDFDLGTLSWSLFRRTAFNFRIAFSASSAKSLVSQIAVALEKAETKKDSLGNRANPKAPREIFGVFTGQGAQWATMGKQLILTSHLAEAVIDDLEESLAALPDRPDWSLKAEMLASKENSRIAEGVISQPLCTAVQLMLVELLREAGIRFSAVVGHSSGEIACAYVSGFLSARDAIRVAFYRGKYTPLARGGSMIAAGTDMSDAIELCNLPKLKGKAQFAASNSGASVTISGNAEAIDLVEMVMQDESKFARKLKVDTAYHSFHMRVCSEPYVASLEECGIRIREPDANDCPWFSSVTNDNIKVTMDMAAALKSIYWRDNMLQPVLFSQALKSALSASPAPGVVLEVGPHPALKGPATMNLEDAIGPVPYFGTLSRGQNDALAITTTLGSIWTILGASRIDFQSFHRAFVKDAKFEISKNLPAYAWDHEKIVWNESRISKAHRLRTCPKHELLGVRLNDEVEGELRWRNYLKPKEMPWISGHQIQSQMVFPAAGFATMALEGARNLAPLDTIRLMELQNFSIHKGLSFLDENSSVEIIFVLSNVHKDDSHITADFACNACLNKDAGDFTSMAGGKVRVTLGEQSAEALPERPHWPNNFIETSVEHFYEELANLGYGYNGMFQGIAELQRTNSGSKGILNIPEDEDSAAQNWIIHPATLDVAFQAVFAAVGAPGDGRLWTMHVPTMINSITVNPSALEVTTGIETSLPFDACLVDAIDDGIAGDIELYDEDGRHAIVQIQGLNVTPLTKPSAADDRKTFAAMEWELASPDLVSDWTEASLSESDRKVSAFAERLSFFILREVCETAPIEEIEVNGTEHQRALLQWALHVVETTRTGKHPTCSKQYLADTWELLERPSKYLAQTNPLVRECLLVKERLQPFLTSELSSEECPGASRAIYDSALFFHTCIERLVGLVKQISFRHRNMRILQIGTGKGSLTQDMLCMLGDNFTSYTCTDTDDVGFDNLRSLFSGPMSERMVYKTLDLEQDPAEQGFNGGYYDLVISSNAIHNTPDLEQSLAHIRSIMRPGGYLAFLEPTSSKSLAIALGSCLDSNWFAGVEDERKYSPLVAQRFWDNTLRDTGFSGIDTATPEEPNYAVPFSVMCSMATDANVDFIRDPLAYSGQKKFNYDLLIIGGATMHTSHLVRGLKRVLSPFFEKVVHAETIVDIGDEIIATQPTTISLAELDEPLFKPFTEEKFKSIVKLCDNLQGMLWVTAGSRGEDPYQNMMVAAGRCLEGEIPNLRLQFLNFDGSDKPTPDLLAFHLLRLHLTLGYPGRPGLKKAGEMLYTIERELTVQNGALRIPRYIFSDTINTRLNSDKRLITHDVDQSATAVELDVSTSSYKLLERMQSSITGFVDMNVSKALLHAIKIGGIGCLYVILGRLQNGKKIIALSETNRSIVSVPESHIVEVDVDEESESNLLLQVAAQLLSMTILTSSSGSVLVNEPSQALAYALISLAAAVGKTVVITSTSSALRGAKLIHASAPDRTLSLAIPKDATLFVDLSHRESRFAKYLPVGCESKNNADLFSHSAFVYGTLDSTALSEAVNRALLSFRHRTEDSDTIHASSIPSQPLRTPSLQILDWTADLTLPAAIVPADESIQFRSNRTYFMVGMAGELGLQTIKWMVLRGARYIALSSRNPKVDQGWLQHIESQGATVKLYAMDVTRRASVQAVHKQLCAEMPPVAGVMNGAMILIDALFSNNDHATFDRVLRPKVDGTVFLDEIFNTTDLDFFIVTSSLASVSGNIGQTAYAAANAFMCSLIAGRRMRGLPGSALNMPGIVGLGYLNRDPRKLWRLKKIGYVNISEWEFFQFFSEAIVAGRPNSGLNPEITAGLQRSDVATVEDPPHWFLTHRFSTLHLVPASGDGATDGDKDGVSTRSKLADSTNENEVSEVVLEGLINILCIRLNMDPAQGTITPDSAIVELGVDSLLAVDMRAWFTKELDLDMPVLKILGGATVQELVDDAVKRLAPELIPNLARDGAPPAEGVIADTNEHIATVEEDVTVEDAISPRETIVVAAASLVATVEEVFTVAPLDLPSFEDSPQDVTITQSWETASYSPSSRTYDSEDVAQCSGVQTPLTTHSDADIELPKAQDRVVSEMTASAEVDGFDTQDGEEPVAKLFSLMPDRVGKPLEFVRKARMSYGTSRFWFLMQYLQDPTSFNLLAHLKCTGKVDDTKAERALRELGNRHEIFRTAFFADSDNLNEPTMGVLKESALRMERRNRVTEADIEAEEQELLNYEFKLEQGETIRMKMLSIDEETHHVLFAFHHIAMDGFSFNILLSEINQLYDSQTLGPVSMQFTDFATRQRKQITEGSLDKEFQFWKDMYSTKLPSGEVTPDFPEPLPLFNLAQSPRKSLDNYEFQESALMLDARTLRQIKAQCRKHKITTFHFFLGVLRTFLFRQLDVDDLVIGIADANRTDNSLDSTIGFMLNLLPLRFKSENGDKGAVFKDVVQAARKIAYDGLAHSKLPFDALLEKLDIPRSAAHSPLFQVWMDYRPFRPDYMPTMFGGEASGTQTVGRNGYDLTLDVNEINGTDVRISFRTQKYLYSASATKTLFDSYMRLVKAFAVNFELPVDSVSLWNQKEIDAAKALGQGPMIESDWPETLSHRIANIAQQHPDREAVKDGCGNSITYDQLQHRIQAISDTLTQAGVKQGSRVAVFQQPSADWVCSLLGIWHAGGAYIPMDLRNSLPRLAQITATAKPTAILCHDETEGKVPELKSSAALVNVSSLEHAQPLTKTQARPNTTAAILFTSGSTGTPKGVILRHAAFRNTIEGLVKQYNIGAEKVLQQSAFTFDFSLDQILCGLVNGGSVFVVPKEQRGDPVAISNIIATEGITYTRATPSEYSSWITYSAEDLRNAVTWTFAWGGGEYMPRSLRESIASLELPTLRLYNSYGPAESITCTKTGVPLEIDEREAENDIPAGFPLPNYSVYIVDRNVELVPQGVKGEILIGGPSVAAGYLNQEKLSSAKFISNPWGNGIVYRTGDTGYLRGDGALMFQGRIAGDTQVKIRGIRIDLQDIESCISSAAEGALQRAVVSVRGGDMLVAHVQFATDQYADERSQQAFLRQLRFLLPLPVYMVPSMFIAVGQLPVNAHGKTDRKAVAELPLPSQAASGGRTGDDLSETEKTLIAIWKEAVPDEMKGVIVPSSQTSFFELGGNSLLLVKLQMLVNQKFGVKLGLIDLFSAASLGAMGTKVDVLLGEN
ncbi:hypothetical protein BCR34DRAFT_599754 [Clohesyomyces aquaticus]|uniref:Hybrid NRPS/PKS enzyme n=1 Tax=Clohesyomyces aquaticus TaxID=1231657 RepID=A0A1Y1ZTM1_9PLEO|nr:hypothetical protein BCR34DRAFT_599754 [Clohesyomyces aquaticus]